MYIKTKNNQMEKPNITENKENKEEEKYINIAGILSDKFQKEFKCNDISKCKGFKRHYRDREKVQKEKLQKELYYVYNEENDNSSKKIQLKNNKDIVFQEEFDRIHSYFLHSLIQYNDDEYVYVDDKYINNISRNAEGRSYSSILNKRPEKMTKTQTTTTTTTTNKNGNNNDNKENDDEDDDGTEYVGQKEDEKWIEPVKDDNTLNEYEVFNMITFYNTKNYAI